MSIDIYSAFGNSVRAKLILCLSQKSKNVSEMITICGLKQSAVSQHLRKLKQSGIVSAEKVGKEIFYSLKYKKAAKISELLIALEQEVYA